ncbi:MAG: hypothetical protein KBT36_03485 [Kurthia sp.]|nr:hypothetical protein [Candidatus Kurthia equi]
MNKFRITMVWILLLCIGVMGGLMTTDSKPQEDTQMPVKVITENNKTTLKIDSYSKKLKSIDTLKELEKTTPIIVEGLKTTEVVRRFHEMKNSSEFRDCYTESNFKIEKVYKNQRNLSQIKKNRLIQIREAEFQLDGQTYTVNGYKKMEKGKRYLLYLDEQHGRFIPKEMVYGKIPLYSDEIGLYDEDQLNIKNIGQAKSINELTNELTPLFKEARRKYK